MAQQVLVSALFRLLRPLVRILLRNGLSVDAFEEVARRVYVDVAENEFALEGKKQTTSRIGVLTGLNRKEVARLLKLPMSDTDAMSAQLNRAQRVLTAWLRDKDFLDEKGDPGILSFSGAGSFSELVKRYSGDMPARAVADELIRVGVLHEEGGALRLLARSYVPHAQSDELSNILGAHVSDLIDAIDHNMTHDREGARFERQVIYEHIPVSKIEGFRELSARWSQRVLEELDRWLASKKTHDNNIDNKSEPTVRLGLGIYEIETWPSRSSKDEA
jgi:hypothetical protein